MRKITDKTRDGNAKSRPRSVASLSRVSQRDALLGHRLRTARQSCGLSQQQAGEKIGVTFQQIQKYEKGRNRISATRLAELCQLYQKPYGFFLNDLTAPSDFELSPDPGHGNIGKYKKLIAIYESFPDRRSQNLAVQCFENMMCAAREAQQKISIN